MSPIGELSDSPNAAAPRFRDLHKRFVVQNLEGGLLARLMSQHANVPRFRLPMEKQVALMPI
jgi:hypothetical protein